VKKLFIVSILTIFINAEFKVPQIIKNIGKPTPIDIVLYAKNKSTKCDLTIKNISYPTDNNKTKIPTIIIKKGHYFQQNYKNILKGEYEFEYTYTKDDKFVDSFLKTKHIVTIHNSKLKIYKKFTPTTLIPIPAICK
jgi:hypothetical protein